ncbi:flavodoxin domain-containing protein [Actinomadura madurae]|uniref:flavodoxin domain-containing protein n=1 Tax=Actinomadura madurae TaxID=1993 RepID=UPI002026CA99|nr:flavodoxin domain-containing protein [Actinomadura madurae]MCP9948948.1 flavodoxin domain-containing protein [Actinomadura madurae]MCP9965720.1 flavodoxin domain-containing protein [Actinomadura madurae]MCP9978194.1 flavodoxin domain-containing protein [Actinomadura madurae]MCQ0014400.1 flavodoxin domain-containing protein [Actinomadura madurae]URN05264.1 flavodoxin domain-containing protein [Actinomadura madurae]
MTILVGYASAHGSTRSIAKRIGALLDERSLLVNVRPMTDVKNAGTYEAFVLGSAIQNRAWLPEALDFLDREHDALDGRPVWLFSVGMPAALRGLWRNFGVKEETLIADVLRTKVAARDHRLFSGVFLREHTSLTGHLLFKALGCRYGDYRDWPRIDAWASTITTNPAHRGRPRSDLPTP